METKMSGSHESTYAAVFQHPISRNLEWREVRSMLGAMPGVEQEENNGTLKVKRNGHTLILHQPIRKNMTDVQELMDLRRFLEQSETATPHAAGTGTHLLVVIDHRLARIYRTELHGTVPQRVVPVDGGDARHLHYVQEDSNGQRKPEIKSFYEAVAKSLKDAGKILLFGTGTGASSAMEQLHAMLLHDHPALAERVIGRVVIDEQHLSEDQLLAQARKYYADQPK